MMTTLDVHTPADRNAFVAERLADELAKHGITEAVTAAPRGVLLSLTTDEAAELMHHLRMVSMGGF